MRFTQLVKDERGFTLIEMLVAVVITGIIGLGGATATYHVMTHSGRNADATVASQHALNSIYWISRDTQMSQTVSPGGVSGFPLTLQWVAWDNVEYEVVYTLEDGALVRTYSADDVVDSELVVAEHIDTETEMTNCGYSNGVLTLEITATVGEGTRTVSVSKVREIVPRPGL